MMTIFAAGLVLFFVLHFATATPALRRRLVARLGENGWKGLVTLGSLAAVALIVFSWQDVPVLILFAPVPLAVKTAPVLVSLALVLIVIGGGNLKANLRRWLHHPMLVGTVLWSGTHLLANGSLRETLLFGAFLAFSVYAYSSLMLAGKRASFVPAWKWDALGVVIGLTVAIGALHGHARLFGVPAY